MPAAARFGSDSGKGYLVALADGTVVAKWEAHRDAIAGAVFLSPCLFATGGKDRAVRFWSWDGQQVRAVWTIRTAAAVTSLGKSANGHRLSVTCEGERGVHVWDLAALGRRFAELGLGIDAPQS